MYVIEKIIKAKIPLLSIAFLISIIGFYHIQWIPTPFMFGRSLPYFIYFTIGYLLKDILLSPNNIDTYKNWIISYCIIGITTSLVIKTVNHSSFINLFGHIIEFTSISILLIYLCKLIQGIRFFRILTYFGMYSLIVLGLHDMYLTTFMIIIQSTIGPMNLTLGILNILLTSLLLWPSIFLLNRYTPQLVGKKEIIKIK
jgi:hypothetical protein